MIISALLLAGSTVRPQTRQQIPTVYEAGHFYAVPETVDHQRLRLLVDTGGAGGSGWLVVDAGAVRRLKLPTVICSLGAARFDVIQSIPFRSGHSLPDTSATPCGSAALVSLTIGHSTHGADGVLGAGYLPDHVWTFDYPQRQIWEEARGWRPTADMHRADLGFPRNMAGKPVSGFPRITIHVDGKALDMLLDTGATAQPTTAGEQASHIPIKNGIGVTSYITASLLERWHHQHPCWRIVDYGDSLLGHARLIEVPQIEIAGLKTGPVWFTERPDANFHDGMSRYMDRRVEGSLGANVYGYWVMTLDYPRATVWFATQ